MSTQVATSHTVHRTTPLKVIRRPPRTDVTHIIQKFLPYAVAFLLSLVVYSSFKSSPVTYPPYSPPNTFAEETPIPPPVDFNSILSKRAERLQQIRSKGEAGVDSKLGHWATWRAQKASELDAKKQAAEEQAKLKTPVPTHVGVFEKVKTKSEGIISDAMDATEWMKTYGQTVAEEVTSTQDFAYDAMYAWRQKAGSIKNAAADKIEDVKEAGVEKAEAVMDTAQDTLEKVADVVQEKLGEVKESASEWVSSGLETLGELRDEVVNRAEGLKTGVSQAAYDLKHRGMAMELLRTQPFNSMMQNGSRMSLGDRLSSFVASIKESLSLDAKAREVSQEWDQLDVSRRADAVIHHLRLLGDDVIEEIFRKLGLDRSECMCAESQPMCPK